MLEDPAGERPANWGADMRALHSGVVVAAVAALGCLLAPSAVRAFDVSGFSFSDFHQSSRSCYDCGRSSRESTSRGSEPEPAPDPREVERRNLIVDMNYQWATGNRRGAIQLALQALAIRDDPALREWVRQNNALLIVDDGSALLKKGDEEGALAAYHRAVAMWPGVLTPKGQRWLADFEQYLARKRQDDAITRGKSERKQQQIDLFTTYVQEGKWAEALAVYNKLPADGPPYLTGENWANVDVAEANLALRDGRLDEAIRKYQSALVENPDNSAARTQLSAAFEIRQKQAASIQPLFDKGTFGSGTVDATGPKPFSEVIASIPELADSPAAERARKGLAAAANHDWTLARAWYQDALNHDPGNPVLKRAVDLADWMAQHHRKGPLTSTAPVAGSISGSRAQVARTLGDMYKELADQILKDNFDNDYDRAKADYFARRLDMEAKEAQAFERTASTASQQRLPFKK